MNMCSDGLVRVCLRRDKLVLSCALYGLLSAPSNYGKYHTHAKKTLKHGAERRSARLLRIESQERRKPVFLGQHQAQTMLMQNLVSEGDCCFKGWPCFAEAF